MGEAAGPGGENSQGSGCLGGVEVVLLSSTVARVSGSEPWRLEVFCAGAYLIDG